MRITLPRIHRQVRKVLLKAPATGVSHSSVQNQTRWSYITLSLASFCLFLIFLYGSQNGFGFISPVSSFLNPLTLFSQDERTYKVFGYIPGWSETKYDDIDLAGLDILAFYDLPLQDDGSFYEDTMGYTMFTSEEAQNLFQRAHDNGVKVVVSITQTTPSSIESILDSKEAQQRVIDNTISHVKEAGIDGVVIDFAYTRPSKEYQSQFTEFVRLFKNEMERQNPGGMVNIAISGKTTKLPFYDLATLETVTDNFLVSMDHVALLEEKGDEASAPYYTYKEEAYWEDVSNALKDVSHYFAQENVALEKAWYGNGEQYPMYKPVEGIVRKSTPQTNTLSTPLDQAVIDELVSQVPTKAQPAARKNLPVIAKALEDEGILTANVLAYALATIEHETAGTFEPIDEIKGEKSARRLGYEGGTVYFGRGFIQLTHLRNYKVMGERIGMGDSLARNPELASHPDVAAKILAAFFVDNGPAQLARQGNFIAARRPVNPDLQAVPIADLAMKYRYIL